MLNAYPTAASEFGRIADLWYALFLLVNSGRVPRYQACFFIREEAEDA